MLSNDPITFQQPFPEIILCDLGFFQIIVPTRLPLKTGKGLESIRPRRLYCDRGWVYYRDRIIGQFEGLKLTSIGHDSPFSITPRIAVGIPLGLEIISDMPLPDAIAKHARFCFQFSPHHQKFHAVFQDILPKQVHIYPLNLDQFFIPKMQQFLKQESAYVLP